MQHIVVKRPGGFDALTVAEAAIPRAGPDEVVVSTEAAGVNYADCLARMGVYKSAREIVGYPLTPGFEFAGTVLAIGEGSHDIRVGDRVFGVTLFNGYATHVCVPRAQVFGVPSELTMLEAAAFPAAFFTAWYAAMRLGNVSSGMTVLVHSAAGGVGSALVQVCALMGCKVVGVTGGPHKVRVVYEAGATEVIDKSTVALWRRANEIAPGGYDVVFDATGIETLRGSYGHLAEMGRLITYGFHSMFSRTSGRPDLLSLAWNYLRTPRFNPIRMAESNTSVLAFNLSYLFQHQLLLTEGMEELLGWVAKGRIRPGRVTTYSLEDAAAAHRALESGQTTGKLALVTGSRNVERSVRRSGAILDRSDNMQSLESQTS